MQLHPYLSFDGQCEAAFRFYEECLGGKIVFMMSYGDSPMGEETPPEWRGKIMHATFTLGEHVLAGADAAPGTYRKPQGFSVALGIGEAADADRIFAALAAKGSVQMPLQETFWALRFGVLTDQFGTPWVINCEKPA